MRRLAVLLLLTACSHSPTGRTQVILVSNEQMAEMGAQAFEQMKMETPPSADPALRSYVDCVARAVTAASDLQADWEVVVFDEPQTVNAFALPGGKIGVYTGLLQVATEPGELAAVLGHEVSHVVARHSAERVSQDELLNVGLSTVGAIFGNSATAGAAMAALGIGSQVGIVLPFSRTQESEADQLGQQLMAKAGFDPAQALTLWQKMGQLGGSGTPAILSDHPSDEDRLQALTKTLPKAEQMFDPAHQANCQR